MALGAAVHESECKTDNKNADVESDSVRKTPVENPENAGRDFPLITMHCSFSAELLKLRNRLMSKY